MSFAEGVGSFALNVPKNMEDAIQATAFQLFSDIIRATPVDEGTARANWILTFNQPSTATVKTKDTSPNGQSSIAKVSQRIFDKERDRYILTNNLPYIERLEFGYSKQAPAGMVRINVARFNQILAKEAKKREL